MIQRSGNTNRKKTNFFESGQRFLTFLMFLHSLGGGKDGLLSKQDSNRKKNNSPHEMVKMVPTTEEGLELCQVAITLSREKREFSII